MMLHVWESYVDFSDSKVQKELQLDDDEVYRMMLKAKFEEEEEEYDTYDPFGEIDTEGRDLMERASPTGNGQRTDGMHIGPESALTVNMDTGEAEKDLVKRFANYGWAEPGLEYDNSLKCIYPEGNSTKQFGEIRVTKVTRPEKKRSITDTTQEDKVCSTFQIRPEWWEPAVWWLENTKWTKLGLGVPGLANKIKCMATWVELALVFQIQTGVRLAPDSLDLKKSRK